MLFGPEGMTQDMRDLLALLQALELGNEAKATILVSQKPALLDLTDAELLNNVTPLIASVYKLARPCSLELFKHLLGNTQHLNAQNTSGKAAIHHVAAHSNSELLSALLAEGPTRVNVDLPDFLGQTPVFIAAHFGRASALYLLIQHHANVNFPDKQGQTPLQTACLRADLLSVQLLLAAGATVNAQDQINRTAIHYLAQSKSTDETAKQQILFTLLEHGLEINQKSQSGKNAFEMAQHFKSSENFANELLAQRVPTLAFLCTKAIISHLKNPYIAEQYQELPSTLVERIESTHRCTKDNT